MKKEKMNSIEIEGIRKYFVKKPSLLGMLLAGQKDVVLKAVDGVSLNILPGETLGLVGESGSGKSTLGKMIVNLHKPTAGKIQFYGRDINAMKGDEYRDYRRKVQIIFQNPYSSLNPRKSIREILSLPLKMQGISHISEKEEYIQDLLNKVGLAKRHANNFPHQFSGGQRQRISIARTLAMKPEFVVADEPVSALDVSIQAQIISLLEELREEFKLTYLFIAHDLSVIHYISNRVAVMYLGKIMEMAPTAELFKHPLHPYTQALLSAIPVIGNGNSKKNRILLQGRVPTPIDLLPGCPFQTRCFAKLGKECEETMPPFVEAGKGHYVACYRTKT